MIHISFLIFIILMCEIKFRAAANINNTETLHSNLFLNYYRNVRPIYDQSSSIGVEITLFIKSIQEFDEVNGKFSYVAALDFFMA